MKFRKVIFFILSLLAVLAVAALAFHKSVLNYAVNKKMSEMGFPLSLEVDSISFNKLALKNIQFGESNFADHLVVHYKTDPQFQLTQIDLKVAKYNLDEINKYTDTKKETSNESLSREFKYCETIQNTKADIEISPYKPFMIALSCLQNRVSFQVQDLSYENYGPFEIDSIWNVATEILKSDFSISLKENLLAEGDLSVSKEKSDIELKFKSPEKGLKLTDLIVNFAPEDAKKKLSKSSGIVFFDGHYIQSSDRIQNRLSLLAENVSLKSEEFEVEGLQLQHSIIDQSTLESPSRQSLKIKSIYFGTQIKDIQIQYKLKNKSQINIEKLRFEFEGATYSAKDFKIFVEQRRTSPLNVKIESLDLERFLKLALGETATAKGELTGHVKIRFVEQKPVIEYGLLKAKGPGQIQYRPPTSAGPPDPNSYSTNPMEILNSYLYDFHYSELSVSLSSDAKYDMNMKLSALGKNPGYLNGKSLKLNVNLEQNLLAAFQAMMLSYNLPKKLEEKITNLGNQ